jgi:hypothetical protein
MTDRNQQLENTIGSTPVGSKESYASPKLVALGDLRELTLGTSRGEVESGATLSFRR